MRQQLFQPFLSLPVSVYGTQLEGALIALVARHFDICDEQVEYPNNPDHDEGYRLWARSRDVKLVNYFHEVIYPERDGSVAFLFRDGRMGIDVADAAQWFIREGLPTFVINTTGDITQASLRNFETNCRCGLFILRQMSEEEQGLVLANDPRVVLPGRRVPDFYPLPDKHPVQ